MWNEINMSACRDNGSMTTACLSLLDRRLVKHLPIPCLQQMAWLRGQVPCCSRVEKRFRRIHRQIMLRPF